MWLPLSSKWGQTRPADDDPRCHLLSTFNHGDLGHGMHEQFRVFPFIFNSFYQVGTPVCRTCRCQISIILQIKKTQLFWETLKRATNFLGITNLGNFSSNWSKLKCTCRTFHFETWLHSPWVRRRRPWPPWSSTCLGYSSSTSGACQVFEALCSGFTLTS